MADGAGFARRLVVPAWVRPEALNVSPELLGMPLAPHGRRALAMGVDLAVVGVLSSTGMFWIVAGIGVLAKQLLRRDPQRPRSRSVLMGAALVVLTVLAVQGASERWAHRDDPPQLATASDDEGVDRDAAALLPAAASAPVAVQLAAARQAETAAERRIAALEAELAEMRKPRPIRWHDDAVKLLHKAGRGFGWAIAYFTLLPYWWRGQTLGKRLFGLRVVELTGKPLGLMTSFGRYGGYAASVATGGIGFAQILWDPNRQAIEDKLAHTVVVDLRAPRASAAGAPDDT
ncbi:MAG: RDD family protein [Betaproteobacteria bacterium]